MCAAKYVIVTPSFNALAWLPSCLRSVQDQGREKLHIHHHVQDGGSTDGTQEYLAQWQQTTRHVPYYHFSYESGADRGMYDAINKAWAQMPADADFCAHLNADEQYLPHCLESTLSYFEQYPQVDILLGSYLVLDADLRYICHRRPVRPRLWSSWLNCSCITCSSFIRVRSMRHFNIHYDTRWRCIGDLILYRKMLQQGVRFKLIPTLTSCFTCTGANLAWTPQSQQEWLQLQREAPYYARYGAGLIYRWVNMQRRVRDLWCEAPREYEIYYGEGEERRRVDIACATCRWGGRQRAEE